MRITCRGKAVLYGIQLLGPIKTASAGISFELFLCLPYEGHIAFESTYSSIFKPDSCPIRKYSRIHEFVFETAIPSIVFLIGWKFSIDKHLISPTIKNLEQIYQLHIFVSIYGKQIIDAISIGRKDIGDKYFRIGFLFKP